MKREGARTPLLYFQPFTGGHHDLYLKHVAAFARQDGAPLAMAVGPGAEWGARLAAEGSPQPHLVQVTAQEADACSSASLIRRGFAQVAAAERAARSSGAATIFYGWIDQALIAFAARRTTRPSAGILFRIPEPGGVGWTLQRKLLYQAAFSNANLRRVLVLDPIAAERLDGERWSRGKIVYLPDPHDDTPSRLASVDRARLEAARAEGRRIYLIAGSLDGRKGIDQTLDALAGLHPEEAARVALFLVGRLVDPGLASAWRRRIAHLRESRPALLVHLEGRFVDDAEFNGFVQAADVVLLPYRGSYMGSSGVLVHAAKAARPVIGTAAGPVGRDITTFELGSTVDADDPSSLCQAIRSDLRSPRALEPASLARFLAGRHPDEFARRILQACHPGYQ